MDKDQLAILRCPDDRTPLAEAEHDLVARLNAAIREGRLQNAAGRPVKRPIDGGLVRQAGDRLYPIVDQIPVLLSDESIPLGQLP